MSDTALSAETPLRWFWALLAAVLSLVGLVLGLYIWDNYHNTDAAARQLLQLQAKSVSDELERRLLAVDRALSELRVSLPESQEQRKELTEQHLRLVGKALEGVNTLSLLDASGSVIASSRAELIGRSFATRPYFQALRSDLNAATLHLSEPFKTVLGPYSIIAAKRVIGPDGEFGGALLAALDPEDFKTVLEAVSTTPDTAVGIIHGLGRVFVFSPASASAPGADTAQPGTFFTRHKDSGQASSVMTGWSKTMNSERVLAARWAAPVGLTLGHTLMVAVSRNQHLLFAAWRTQAAALLAIYVALFLVSVAGMLLYQRRVRINVREKQEQVVAREAAQREVGHALALLNATGRIARVGGWSLDVASRVLSWSDEVYRIHELPVGTPITVEQAIAYYAAQSVPRISAAVQAVIAGGGEFDLELELITASGRRIWVRAQGEGLLDSVSGKALRVYGAFQDITASKQAELETRRTLLLLQSFIDQVPGLAYIKDAELRFRMVNQSFKSIGMAPTALIGKTIADVLPGDFAEQVSHDDVLALAGEKPGIFRYEYRGRHYESRRFVIQEESGQRLLGGITTDVTRRQRSVQRVEALLEISEISGGLAESAFLTQGLELLERATSSPIGALYFVHEDQDTIELACASACAMQGLESAPCQHHPVSQGGIWSEAFHQQKAVVINDYPAYQPKRGLPSGHVPLLRFAYVPVLEDGKVRMLLGMGNKPVDYDDFDVETVQLIGNDLWRVVQRARMQAQLQQRLSELKALNLKLADAQGQLLQSEKLAAIGQLAAGVAHEINTPVGFVRSNLGTLGEYVQDLLQIDRAYRDIEDQLSALAPQVFAGVDALKKDCDHDFLVADLTQLLRESTDGLDRVTKIVQDLKGFARVGETGWLRADLLAGLDSTLNMVRNEVKYKAEVVRELVDLPPVWCIPSQINQVFMNLLVNAAQAIVAQGRITLRCGQDGDCVWFEVQDNGCGIAPDNLARVFDPFYTSKDVGKGTGLGLSLVWGIVQRHRGTIEVQSELGAGSTFRLRLPIEGPVSEPISTSII